MTLRGQDVPLPKQFNATVSKLKSLDQKVKCFLVNTRLISNVFDLY